MTDTDTDYSLAYLRVVGYEQKTLLGELLIAVTQLNTLLSSLPAPVVTVSPPIIPPISVPELNLAELELFLERHQGVTKHALEDIVKLLADWKKSLAAAPPRAASSGPGSVRLLDNEREYISEANPLPVTTIGATQGLTDAQLRASPVPVSTTVVTSPIFGTRADTFITVGNGVVMDRSTSPLRSYGVQVKGTGGAASLWSVELQGSLNNTQWSPIITHNEVDGDGSTKWSGAITAPSLYVRSRVVVLTLGVASNIVVTILGSG